MIRRNIALALVSLATLLGGPAPAAAQSVTVKLGTMAPDGSTWHQLLKEMGEKWQAASGGRVKLKIFPGGIQGNEGDVIRKMRVDQLQAGAVSIVGLRDIDPAPQGLGTPGLVTDDEELAHVYEKLAPYWEKKLDAQGFMVLSWGDTGWAHIFTKRKIRTPKDINGLKMFAWSGDPGAFEAWKAVGFQPVVISSTDMLPSLSTGMIEGFATTPILAMTARWYEQTKYMPNVRWGRLAGATIMTKKAWEKIPEAMRPKLLEIAREVGHKINAEVSKLGADSIESMKKNGLEVLELTPAEQAEWDAAALKVWPVLRGTICSAEDFDLLVKTRDEYRATKKAGAGGGEKK
jgi:TRAP-type C4-dicarboxylate transport system substrate-binding protein